MDEIVRQAIAKWPNVPHCYGWLALDARGAWRMRDGRAQQLDLPGDKLNQPALLNFINSNYAADERGCWYFQNGPQRVYLQLGATPFIARTDPRQGLLLHTGEPMEVIERGWLTEAGALVLQAGSTVAQLDDRDMAQAMAWLRLDGEPVSDEGLMRWLTGGAGQLSLQYGEQAVMLERIEASALPRALGFVQRPMPPVSKP